MDESLYRDSLRRCFAGRKTIVVGGPLTVLGGLARELRDLGADKPFLLGSETGTGEMPSAEDAEWRSLEVRAPDVITGMRRYEELLVDPPPQVAEALDRYDPDRTALAVGLILLGEVPSVAGRRRLGIPTAKASRVPAVVKAPAQEWG